MQLLPGLYYLLALIAYPLIGYYLLFKKDRTGNKSTFRLVILEVCWVLFWPVMLIKNKFN